jgi:hypothetical protein
VVNHGTMKALWRMGVHFRVDIDGGVVSSACRPFYVYIRIFNGLGGLEVAYWPLVPKFAGSNPAEAVGFLRAKKSSARLPSEGN